LSSSANIFQDSLSCRLLQTLTNNSLLDHQAIWVLVYLDLFSLPAY
jgi:hypothetical protein